MAIRREWRPDIAPLRPASRPRFARSPLRSAEAFTVRGVTAQVLLAGKLQPFSIGDPIMTWNSFHRFTLTSCVLAFEIGFSLLASGRFATAQNLFVAEDGASVGAAYIYEFKPNGTRSTFASGLYAPAALAFNSSGDLFVAGDSAVNGGPPDQGYIYEFTPNGTQSTFASGLVDGPVALAFSSSGDLFVGAGNNIYEYTPNGTQSTFASVNDVVDWRLTAVATSLRATAFIQQTFTSSRPMGPDRPSRVPRLGYSRKAGG